MNKFLSFSRLSMYVGFFVLLMTTISCSSSRTLGIEEGWEILGENKVNFVKDKDEIDIRSQNTYTALRFLVEDRDIRINYVKIIFVNGDALEPAIDDVIAAGQQSRIIELDREGKTIDRLEFKYRTTGNILKGRANVVILGRRFDRYRY